MLTKDQLAEALQGVNVAELAKATGVSTKTIYRYRSGTDHSPNLRTVTQLLAAAKALRKRAAKVAA